MHKQTYIALFPGGFKPFHDGHYTMVKKVINNNPNLDFLYLIVSKKDRENISRNSTLWFLKKSDIFKLYPKLNVFLTDEASPVKACYQEVINSNEDFLYAMVDSDKDDIKTASRSEAFMKAFSEGGKQWNGIDKVWRLNLDRQSLRTNEDIVSATNCREAIRNNDFNSFIKNYKIMLNDKICSISLLRQYFYVLGCEIGQKFIW